MAERSVRESALLGERLITLHHASGLEIALIPKQQKKAYALFATRYGSMDRCFKTAEDGDFVTVPDGIAHFLEHKMFENEDGSDTFSQFADHQASANAFTSNEMTAYLFSSTEDYHENLRVLLSFVTSPYFTEETVKKELGIINQEIGMYRDDPYYQVYFGLVNALYRESNLKIDIAGTEESIAEITPEILYRCHRTFYDPHNMLLCLCGPFDEKKVLALCDEILPPSKDLRVEKRYPEEPAEITCPLVEKKLSVSLPLFLAGMKDVHFSPEDSAEEKCRRMLEQEILCDLLFGKSGDLYEALYTEGLVTDGFSATYNFSANYGFLEMGGESRDPQKVFDRILARVKQALASPEAAFSEEDFSRCKKACYSHMVQNWNSPSQIAHSFVELRFHGVDLLSLSEVIAKITREDVIRRFVSSYDPERFAMSVVSPLKQKGAC